MAEILVPVSVGELVDKVTILKIKRERLTEPTKLENVRRELDALLKICEAHKIDLTSQVVEQLQEVNARLWDIEDGKRAKERNKTFDAEFIELARSVYILNDKRFALKSEINKLSGSLYVEEKSHKPY